MVDLSRGRVELWCYRPAFNVLSVWLDNQQRDLCMFWQPALTVYLSMN